MRVRHSPCNTHHTMTPSRRFQRRRENFTCAHCGAITAGNGYTNHCTQCLWSRHVDINPGDRAATCGGLMEPCDYEIKGGETILLHRCTACGFERRNRLAPNDDLAALLIIGRR